MPENGSVAFLGLGHMGGPMALNLVRAGYRVTGFDVVPAAMEAARVQGVPVAATAVEALAGADVVLTMFPSGRHVLDAYRGNPGHPGQPGEPGLLAAAPPGTMFLDCSTINVDEAREAARLAIEAGHRSVDAPVSGGVVGAEAGTLTFMAGGDAAGFEEVLPLLEVMGRRVVHCGAHGAGQAAKICNNMILGVSMIAVSEAFVLGEKLGLTHQALFDVASAASGQCWALTTNCPVPGPVPSSPANRDYQPGFASALMAKDLNLAVNALDSTGVAGQMGALAARIYDRFAAEGGAGRDFSAIITDIRGASEPQAGDGPAGAGGTEVPGRRPAITAYDDGSPE
ncbi:MULTISPECIES: 3-hydroxyisobutyrate dehydrogenase [Pseudarthrobacter]|uniref:3-hydroxyisobutyrate dehydrogenase n=1 Tax=Pseudarthrobacter niigatensis TaxID=369935 RepID=A0AAJ1WG18_9MICC|nr:3-hydroxyisobutyrate dehydrogenase [Pseudarthrobacter niigatensis]MDQ0146562.1 3-hydroxyisobutyrate dehydrogenase [Pseudarthrobacter niigatensis]MDQ0266727.1 3-hydroxyisobutyrate dehydrogenase [Pseudarthrobacter niigatensis]